jgi:hypothetical protein
MLLRNVGLLSTDYMVLHPRKILHNHRCENLKSYSNVLVSIMIYVQQARVRVNKTVV